jgi:hypothetical protein
LNAASAPAKTIFIRVKWKGKLAILLSYYSFVNSCLNMKDRVPVHHPVHPIASAAQLTLQIVKS